jgi:YesN/AraC family two-component response regulator
MLKSCFKTSSLSSGNSCDFGGGVVSLVGPYPFILLFVFALTLILPEETLGHLSVISVARIFTVMVNIALLQSIREMMLSKRFSAGVNVESTEDHIATYEDDEELYKRLMDFFEPEKPYLNPKLTINELAVTLYTNKTYLSALINRRFKMNFSQFLNHYRVREAQRVFRHNPSLSLKSLCEMSGFGSMASFNIAFRLFSGYTPAEWCREQKIKMRNKDNQGDVVVEKV